jgi:predicted nucleic acid-binding protein
VKRPERNLPDTNVIVRYLVADDPVLHAKAKEFFDRVRNGGARAVILEGVVAECVYVLTKIYRVPRDRAAAGLIDLLRYKGIANDDRLELIQALSLFSEENLDIVDCILCAKAAAAGERLFTFDGELNRLVNRARPMRQD